MTPVKFQRLQFKDVILTVLSNTECTVESTKLKKKTGVRGIYEIMRIRFDADTIAVHKFSPAVAILDDRPVAVPPDAVIYSHAQLPAENWSKYNSAGRFLSMNRAKTPKFTRWDTDARGVLFDLEDFFECTFYADFTKINFLQSGTIKIEPPNRK